MSEDCNEEDDLPEDEPPPRKARADGPDPAELDLQAELRYLGDLTAPFAWPVISFETGRLLNHLKFNMIRAWVAPIPPKIDAARRVARELISRSRLRLSSLTAREEFDAAVTDVVEDRLTRLDSEGHVGDVQELIDHYISPPVLPEDYLDLDFERGYLIDSTFQGLLDALKGIEAKVLEGLAENHVAFLRLGERLDQGVRRPDIHHYLFESKGSCKWWHHGELKQAKRYSWVTLEPGEVPPEGPWLDRTRDLLRESGMLSAHVEDLLRASMETKADRVSLVESLAIALRPILTAWEASGTAETQSSSPRSCLPTGLSPVVPDSKAVDDLGGEKPSRVGLAGSGAEADSNPPSGTEANDDMARGIESQGRSYLDISFDNGRWIVRRRGWKEEINLSGKKLPWLILKKLVASQGSPCTREQLKECWPEKTDTLLQNHSVKQMINTLKPYLKKLGLVIPRAKTNTGWLLEDVGDSTVTVTDVSVTPAGPSVEDDS